MTIINIAQVVYIVVGVLAILYVTFRKTNKTTLSNVEYAATLRNPNANSMDNVVYTNVCEYKR